MSEHILSTGFIFAMDNNWNRATPSHTSTDLVTSKYMWSFSDWKKLISVLDLYVHENFFWKHCVWKIEFPGNHRGNYKTLLLLARTAVLRQSSIDSTHRSTQRHPYSCRKEREGGKACGWLLRTNMKHRGALMGYFSLSVCLSVVLFGSSNVNK